MARKTREVETEAVEESPEFTHEEVVKILAHNVKLGLVHLPPDFRADKADETSESGEIES